MYVLADINPIGGISKTDLKKFIGYAKDAFNLPILSRCASAILHKELHFTLSASFLDAVPTAELEPITETYIQADEVCPLYYHQTLLYLFHLFRRIWA